LRYGASGGADGVNDLHPDALPLMLEQLQAVRYAVE